MQVVATALRVLEEVITGQPLGVSELARRTRMPKSTVQRALLTLADEGWIQPDPEGSKTWIQTPKILALASRGRGAGIRDIAMPVMKKLLEAVNENVHLTVRQNDDVVVLDKVDSSHPVRVFDPLGTTIPLHASASGKAILAWSGDDSIEDYLNHRLATHFTADTITDPDSLRTELEHIRESGYSYNRGEWRSEIKGIAAPIHEKHGTPRFAVSLSIPDHRLPETKVPELAALVTEAARNIAHAL